MSKFKMQFPRNKEMCMGEPVSHPMQFFITIALEVNKRKIFLFHKVQYDFVLGALGLKPLGLLTSLILAISVYGPADYAGYH